MATRERATFRVGDWVVHPEHGMGQVVRLETKSFAGAEPRLYYEVEGLKSTFWVPMEISAATLRRRTVRADLPHYRHVLTSRPTELDKDRRVRQLDVSQRLKQGTFAQVCEVVRDLTARSWRKPLNESDSLALRRARDSLCQEWAAAAEISLTEAIQEIDMLLAEAKQAHHT